MSISYALFTSSTGADALTACNVTTLQSVVGYCGLTATRYFICTAINTIIYAIPTSVLISVPN